MTFRMNDWLTNTFDKNFVEVEYPQYLNDKPTGNVTNINGVAHSAHRPMNGHWVLHGVEYEFDDYIKRLEELYGESHAAMMKLKWSARDWHENPWPARPPITKRKE